MYSTCTATVTVTYADTLTEGGRGESGRLLCHMICHMMYVCVGETHVHGLYMYIPCVRVTMDVQMVL